MHFHHGARDRKKSCFASGLPAAHLFTDLYWFSISTLNELSSWCVIGSPIQSKFPCCCAAENCAASCRGILQAEGLLEVRGCWCRLLNGSSQTYGWYKSTCTCLSRLGLGQRTVCSVSHCSSMKHYPKESSKIFAGYFTSL